MIVSYDEDEFVSTHRLVPIDSIIGSWTLIKEGYILNKNPLLLWSESSQAKAFPIHNSLFGIFVSYEWPEDSQNWSNNTLDFKMRMYSITSYSPLTMGKEVMIVPLSYSWWEYQFWGSDIQPMGRDHPYREYGINLME
jgi:hypothetical protein